jgi:hypothetical protein
MGNIPCTPQTEVCVGPRAGLVNLGKPKILPTRIQTPDHPAHRTDTMLTMIPKLQPRTGHDGPGLADLLPGKKPCTHYTGG